jgi:hypothetical protein
MDHPRRIDPGNPWRCEARDGQVLEDCSLRDDVIYLTLPAPPPLAFFARRRRIGTLPAPRTLSLLAVFCPRLG